jgi:hypothetical protein
MMAQTIMEILVKIMDKNKDNSKNRLAEEQAFAECKQHSEIGFQETDQRSTGKNRIGSISFNEAE